MKRFTSPSSMSCSQSCLRNSLCTSTKFKKGSKQSDKEICELNKYDSGLANGDNKLQGHPTNLFLTLSVPQRNLVGWQNSSCSDELAGKFVLGLMMFPSISSIAW